MRKSISMAMVLTFACSLLSPPAHAAFTNIQAERERHGTDCTWSTENGVSVVRLESYFPFVAGDNAALVVAIDQVTNNGEFVNGAVLRLIRVNVKIHKNFHFKEVRPGVNIEYDDNGKQHQMLNLAWTDLQRTAVEHGYTQLTYDFQTAQGHPLTVRHIVVGGHELTSDKVGAMDIVVTGFKAFDPDLKELTNQHNFDVKVVTPGSDPLLNNLKCTYD